MHKNKAGVRGDEAYSPRSFGRILLDKEQRGDADGQSGQTNEFGRDFKVDTSQSGQFQFMIWIWVRKEGGRGCARSGILHGSCRDTSCTEGKLDAVCNVLLLGTEQLRNQIAGEICNTIGHDLRITCHTVHYGCILCACLCPSGDCGLVSDIQYK